ncbi:MAG TPA: flagellar basal body protein [Ideonella sp.]|uniref:flagellar basal body rod protein FlgB n=1 Tax=Ideonella sp. TaxID=1929293 RepID=UPI002E33B933|nr:flagellar basal body protein [Ideonella sp.]HEX5682647.1 flagellar basal body protein [Ideonella sp.]
MNTPSIEALTLPALSTAMDAAMIRQQVTANNIANANTQGFTAQRVSFDVAMEAAAGGADAPLQARLQPQVGLSVDGAVRLDSEVAAMAQNSAHYQVLLKALNRHLSIMATAVSDGKR